MRPAKFILPVLVAMLAATHSAGAQNEWWNNDPSYVTPIEEAAVVARRPLGEIGQQKTELDSAALKLTVSQSMADVLTFNSSIFVKQYGRGSLSTVSFRGTAASHTQVTWNGMKINSPMLGMTDFSMIPSFFTDKASLLHGSSSLAVASGGLGGAVLLATEPDGNFAYCKAYLTALYGEPVRMDPETLRTDPEKTVEDGSVYAWEKDGMRIWITEIGEAMTAICYAPD